MSAATQILVDEATLSPHHLVRHGLLSGHTGKNKAEALKEEILSIYRHNPSLVEIEAVAGSGHDLWQDPAKIAGCSYLIDASASPAMLNAITSATGLPSELRVCRCEIAHQGGLGFFLVEGAMRNPRLDDLQAYIFDLARHDDAISAWLTRHREEIEALRGPALEEIGIGISCSSSTMRLGDDIVSFHAAQFTLGLKHPPRDGLGQLGRVQISFLNVDNSLEATTKTFLVPPVTIIHPSNAPDWSIRLMAGAIQDLDTQMQRAGRRETGGLLIGLIHRKRKAIYVTHVLPPSQDSHGSPYAFKRGVVDYPKILDDIERRTGGLLGYVGEWHTHPWGPAESSDRDQEATEQIRRNLDPVGLPTHILIMAPERLASYIFGV